MAGCAVLLKFSHMTEVFREIETEIFFQIGHCAANGLPQCPGYVLVTTNF